MHQKSWNLKWALHTVVLSLAFLGCAKKPKTSFEEPAARAEAPEATYHAAQDISNEELRRHQLMAEARELFQTIYFPLDQSILDARARTLLTGIQKFMAAHPEISFTVAGHCDERGTEEYNLALGEQRARAVTKYLADLGISGSRMKTLSYGEERPASEGHSESAWKLNRRAEFTPEFRFELSGAQP